MNCWGVLPAAGIGSRMRSAVPKQYLRIAGATVLEHSIRALLAEPRITQVVVALRRADPWAEEVAILRDPRVRCVNGGAERSDSVSAALDALQERALPADWVLVHDAARPCLSAAALSQLVDQVLGGDCGGLLAQPVADTVKRVDQAGRVLATCDRSELWLAQTPQMFRLGELQAALMAARECGLAVTDEASAMEFAGHPVQVISAPRSNIKLTAPEDIEWAQWYLESRAGATQRVGE